MTLSLPYKKINKKKYNENNFYVGSLWKGDLHCKLHFGTSRSFLAFKGFRGNCWRDVLW